MHLLERSDIESLTTNAVAEKAGVSIGTLYQYFHGKQAILDALAQREIEGLAARVIATMTRSPPPAADERIRMIVRAVLETYGGRRRVHRLLLEHALTRGAGTRLNPLYSAIAEQLSGGRNGAADEAAQRLSAAEAFVLTHAVAGVMRGLVTATGTGVAIEQAEVEAALTRLVAGYSR